MWQSGAVKKEFRRVFRPQERSKADKEDEGESESEGRVREGGERAFVCSMCSVFLQSKSTGIAGKLALPPWARWGSRGRVFLTNSSIRWSNNLQHFKFSRNMRAIRGLFYTFSTKKERARNGGWRICPTNYIARTVIVQMRTASQIVQCTS
jgi:hypothetical protein